MEGMKMRCPLPIDWLDFIETGEPDALAAHLEECASCQTLVESLRGGADELGNWLSKVDLTQAVVWRPRPIKSTGFGQLVLNATSYAGEDADYADVPRLLFIVIDDGRRIGDRRWFTVVPADTDVENASSTDLLLTAEETSLGVPLRVIFSMQTSVAEEQLDEEVATLTPGGAEVVRQALAAHLDEARYGLPLAGPDDERLAVDREIEEVVRQLRTPFFAAALEEGETEEAAAPAQVTALGERRQRALPLVFFDLNWLRVKGDQLAWAAKTEPEETVVRATLRTEVGELEGQLHYEMWRDQLLFLIERAEGFGNFSISLVLHTKASAEIESDPFIPRAGQEVEVGAVFLDEIDKLAAKVG